jgi:hypothetical protein
MDYKAFGYDKFNVFFMATSFTAIEIGLLYFTASLFFDQMFIGTATFCVCAILNGFGLAYFYRKFLRATLKNEPAIEIDEETIQFNISNWALSWKEIESIDSTLYGIQFNLKNGNEANIGLKYVGGDWDAIRDTINEYFENCKLP